MCCAALTGAILLLCSASVSETMASSQKIPARNFLSPLSVQHNQRSLSRAQTCIAVLGGCGAGVLGLSGFAGFLLYILVSLMLSGMLYHKMDGKVESYFQSKWSFLFGGITQEILSFILFWCVVYDICHIY